MHQRWLTKRDENKMITGFCCMESMVHGANGLIAHKHETLIRNILAAYARREGCLPRRPRDQLRNMLKRTVFIAHRVSQ